MVFICKACGAPPPQALLGVLLKARVNTNPKLLHAGATFPTLCVEASIAKETQLWTYDQI